ncbi:allophanate hydrolase subunit 1 [Rhodococcus rhodnii LMG 5362]|uniref:Allophanate hydrolase subunit 1 n=1 Tax=Rhodococcus rhodnii LMG 5362 TaxID=1273125 RepID=R7WMT9_9NOCA|nr:allophanate hydrolase subunit 1 [Rhodococcus rhodnii LMG 5362]
MTAAGDVSGSAYVRDRVRLDALASECDRLIAGFDALLVPTAPFQPTRAEVAAEPVAANSRVGTYTNFCNLLDMCGVAVPAGVVDEGDAGEAQFGVTVVARAFHDAVALDLARRVVVAPRSVAAAEASGPLPRPDRPWPEVAGASSTALFVVGAHLRGQPLEGQLTALGARWGGAARTAPRYRLSALDTVPAKPGLTRVDSGAVIEGEIWHLSDGALGRFLAALPAPMNLGAVELDDGTGGDGTWVVGFGCAADAAAAAVDITEYGGWRAYLGALRS